MISQRYLPGCGSSWDQNQRRYAMLEPGKSTVRGGASARGFSGPTSDHFTPSFNVCPEKRLKVSMPIPGFIRMSSISVGRMTTVCSVCAAARVQKKTNTRTNVRVIMSDLYSHVGRMGSGEYLRFSKR